MSTQKTIAKEAKKDLLAKTVGAALLGTSAYLFLWTDHSSLEMTILLVALLVLGLGLSTITMNQNRSGYYRLFAGSIIVGGFLIAPTLLRECVNDAVSQKAGLIHLSEMLVVVFAAVALCYIGTKIIGNRHALFQKEFKKISTGLAIACLGVTGFGVQLMVPTMQVAEYSTFVSLGVIWIGMSIFILGFLNSRKASPWVWAAGITVILAGSGVVTAAGLTAIGGDTLLSPAVTIHAAIGFGSLILLMSVYYSLTWCYSHRGPVGAQDNGMQNRR